MKSERALSAVDLSQVDVAQRLTTSLRQVLGWNDRLFKAIDQAIRDIYGDSFPDEEVHIAHIVGFTADELLGMLSDVQMSGLARVIKELGLKFKVNRGCKMGDPATFIGDDDDWTDDDTNQLNAAVHGEPKPASPPEAEAVVEVAKQQDVEAPEVAEISPEPEAEEPDASQHDSPKRTTKSTSLEKVISPAHAKILRDELGVRILEDLGNELRKDVEDALRQAPHANGTTPKILGQLDAAMREANLAFLDQPQRRQTHSSAPIQIPSTRKHRTGQKKPGRTSSASKVKKPKHDWRPWMRARNDLIEAGFAKAGRTHIGKIDAELAQRLRIIGPFFLEEFRLYTQSQLWLLLIGIGYTENTELDRLTTTIANALADKRLQFAPEEAEAVV